MTESSETSGANVPGAFLDRRLMITILAAGTILFLVYPTEPLYFGNQNTKFLHGMAQAGVGHLAEDWQAGTKDPLVPFSWLVYVTARYLHPSAYYLYQYISFILYAGGIVLIASFVGGVSQNSRRVATGFLIVFLAFQSNNVTETLWDGVAKQYIIDVAFQPSAFGVFLILAPPLVLAGWGKVAVALVGLAAWMHPAYVIPGIILLWSMGAVSLFRKEHRELFGWGGVAAGTLLCLSSAGYVYWRMLPTSPELAEQAAWIIAKIRIPHHSDPARWGTKADTILKSALVGTAVWFSRRNAYGIIIGASACAIGGLTLLTTLKGDNQLAIAAPWRASAYVVPMAWVVLLTRFAAWTDHWAGEREGRRKGLAVALAFLTLAGLGAGLYTKYKNYVLREPPVYYGWVRDHYQPGDLYLTDPSDTDFRLATGVPQFVSWKSHPYQDTEVIEWHRRLRLAESITRPDEMPCEEIADVVRDYGVTHLIVPLDVRNDGCLFLSDVYQGGGYAILEVEDRGRGGRHRS